MVNFNGSVTALQTTINDNDKGKKIPQKYVGLTKVVVLLLAAGLIYYLVKKD